MYRPLSPHVLIYRAQLSSILSIFHRVTGVILVAGVTFLWLSLSVISPLRAQYIAYLTGYCLNTYLAWVGIVMSALAFVCLLYHILSGIRHLLWDFFGSYYLNRTSITKTSYLILFISIMSCVAVATFI